MRKVKLKNNKKLIAQFDYDYRECYSHGCLVLQNKEDIKDLIGLVAYNYESRFFALRDYGNQNY